MKKISIITAVYNREDTIRYAIQSLKIQKSSNFFTIEHIIVDGLSNDSTLKIIEKIKIPNTVTIVEKDNGIYDALNKGIKLATGDYIGILHSDDEFNDDMVLMDIFNAFQNPNIDFVYGDIEYISNKAPYKVIRRWKSGPFNILNLKLGWMPPHPSFFMRKDSIRNIGCFDNNFKIASDYDFVLRCLSQNTINIKYIERVLVRMRMGGESNKNLKKIVLKMYEDYKIIKIHKLGGFLTLLNKNLRKIKQFK